MKISNNIYIPVKFGKNNKIVYCLDNNRRTRMYRSKEALKKHMKNPYDLILVYTQPRIMRPVE